MQKVNITIDGQEVLAESGSTVLEAATAAGIEIPTLCHHPALKPVGNCRICLVEIERQRNLQASCVFPVSDGMVVHTDSPKVKEARRFVLELLLSDHSFYCMYCEMSGDCERDLSAEHPDKARHLRILMGDWLAENLGGLSVSLSSDQLDRLTGAGA